MLKNVVYAIAALFLITGCSRDVETLDEFYRGFDQRPSDYSEWTAEIELFMVLGEHQSNWRGIFIGKDDLLYGVINYADVNRRIPELKLTVDADGIQWLEIPGDPTEVHKLDRAPWLEGQPESAGFALPGNMDAALPLGSFQHLPSALSAIDTLYAPRVTEIDVLEGENVVLFEGALTPETIEELDPKHFLRDAGIPFEQVHIVIRVKDGLPRRIEFSGEGNGLISIDYTKIVLDPAQNVELFRYQPPENALITDVTATAAASYCGVSPGHVALRPTPEAELDTPDVN